jgi:hypothetical protein
LQSGLAVLLFVSKRLRARSSRSIEKERYSPSAAPSDPAHHNKKGHDNKSGKLKNMLLTVSQFMKTKKKKDKQRYIHVVQI